MKFLRPIVGAILLILGALSLPYALAATGQAAVQFWIYTGAYLVAAILVFIGNEFGAWGAILVPTVFLVIAGASIAQAPSEAEIPIETWLSIVASVAALVGGALLVRADKPNA